MAQNLVTELSERVQKRFGKNIITRVISITGPDHCPQVTVEIEIPDDEQTCYQATAGNKRNAAVEAAKIALKELF